LSDDGKLILLSLSGRLYVFNRDTRDVRELDAGNGTILDPKFAPDGKSIGYVLDQDVWVYDLGTNKAHQVTTGGTEKVTHGLAEFVAQEEMRRYSGYWWSPDSQWIAYEEADASDVEVWYVADPAKPDQAGQPSYYPRPGKNNVKVRLGIISVKGGDTTWGEWDRKKYPYLATVKWQKGGPLTILVQDRLQQEEVLCTVDAKSGKTTALLTEKDECWLNLDQDMPRWLEDGSGFLWSSERERGPRLELRDATGKLLRVLDSENYSDLQGVDAKAGLVYYSGGDNSTEMHLYRVALDGGKPVRLSQEPGQHS